MTKLTTRKTALSRKKNNKGFSLIGLVIVITIMAILTALLAPQLLRYVEQSRVAKDETTIDEVYRAIQISLTDETVFHATSDGDTVKLSGSTITASNANLADDLHKTLGGTHTTGATTITLKTALVSNLYKSATITFTIGIDGYLVTVTR